MLIKKIILGLIFICVAFIAFSKEIYWYTDLKKAFSAAKKENKIIMIDVYTEGCGWCKELDKRTYTHSDVIKIAEELINLKINPEKNQEGRDFVGKYNISGYPTILFVDADGTFIGKIGGFIEGEPFAQKMRLIFDSVEQIAKLKKEYENGNLDSTLELLNLYMALDRDSDAIPIILDLKTSNKLPFIPDYYFVLAYYYLDQSEYKLSLQNFKYIVDNFSNSGEPYYHAAYMRGYIMSLDGDKKEAIAYLKEIQSDPDNIYKSQFTELIEYLEE